MSNQNLNDERLAPSDTPWMSLAEQANGAPTHGDGNEFPATSADHDGVIDPLSRRNFMQLMGASLALAGVGTACKRYEREEIVPLARRPEGHVPAQTQKYATAFELGGVAQSLLVTSYEGRPIHVEGNPEHPFSASAGGGHAGCSTFAQASVLHLYDPDRDPSQAGKSNTLTFEAFQTWLKDAGKTFVQGLRVLSEATSSPTMMALRQALTAGGAQWFEYEALSWDNEREGMKLAFGRSVRPIARLDQAKTIVTFDADVFVEHRAALHYSKDFARSRKPNGTLGGDQMNRLWSVESVFTNTGAIADHRLPLRSEQILPLVAALEAAVAGGAAPAAEFLKESAVSQFVAVLAEELHTNRGHVALIAGRRQPAIVHAMIARLNAMLGAVVDYVEDLEGDRPSHVDAIAKLSSEMAAGTVGSLLIIGGNPAFDAPADSKFGEALSKVKHSVHLAEYANETSALCSNHVARAHYLEAWGDARTFDGTITVAQPLIAPIYGAVSAADLLATLLGRVEYGEQLVRSTHGDIDWKRAVHDGFIAGTAAKVVAVQPSIFAAPTMAPSQLAGAVRPNGELEVVFVPSHASYDGRYANNAWLQETPDFLTKVTWDNYALIAPATALALGIENDSIIKVKTTSGEVEVAAYVMPGQAKGSIGVVLGGGRTKAGQVGGNGKTRVGFNTYPLRSKAGFDIVSGASIAKTGKSFPLANVQEHWDFRAGLKKELGEQEIAKRLPILVKEVPLKTFAEEHEWTAKEADPYFHDSKRDHSLFEERVYEGHRWAMAIDLGNCTGCNACAVACQSENNIPVVGKEQVIKSREMSWIRIDRYFKGSVDNPQIVHQPVGCQQCENAPCEQVCPVGATVHSDEGLNDMAYNRCVGTRYCLNNCPYRVRRFNFLDYNKEFKEARNRVRQLLFNPDVTVRHRGVMEKCSYCVQRIQNVKIKHKSEIRQGLASGDVQGVIPDGAIVTACQAACPTEAIVFGDLADANSRVTKLHRDRRSYELLADLYTKPRTQFLARVRNPNPRMHAGESQAAAHHEGGH